MSDSHPATAQPLPPHAQLIEMGGAYRVSRIVQVAAQVGIADELAAAPKSAAELAGPMGLHTPALHRFMRTLAGLGILTERAGQRFALTSLGEALKSGAPGSARATLITFAIHSPGWEEMIYSLQTGKTGFEKALGKPIFDYLAQHPAEAAYFSEAMVGIHGAEPPTVAAAYDFSNCKCVVDVGGATGNLLATILAHYPGVRGILFDRPHVVSEAPAMLAAHGVSDRITVEGGNFFESAPMGGDTYILSHIIHDWDEDQCVTILANCRKAMQPNGRILIVEMVLPAGDTPHPGKVFDMTMLVIPGGQERTEAEYADLVGKAGFRLTRVVPTTSAVSIVECVQA